MKCFWMLFIALGIFLLCAVAIKLNKRTSDRRQRNELYMLNLIKNGVAERLFDGGELPKNWSSLSNIRTWEFVTNFTPPATELYTVLPRPVFFNNPVRTGVVFLVPGSHEPWNGAK